MLKEESHGCFTVPIVGKASEDRAADKTALAARLLFGPPAAPALGKEPRDRTSAGEHLVHAATLCSLPMREGGQENCIQRTVKANTAEPNGTSDSHMETRNASLKEEALPNIRSVSFKLTQGLIVAFRAGNCSSPMDLW